MVAVAYRRGSQRGRVGAGLGLGETETAQPFAAGVFGQIGAFLFLGAVEYDRGRADAVVGADQRAERRRSLAEFDRNENFLFHGQAEAAVFFRNGQPEETEFLHFAHDFLGHAFLVRQAVFRRDQPFADESLDQCK